MQFKTKLTTQNGIAVIVCPASKEIESLKDCECDIIIKKHREKRSLDANAYAWVLLGKLAEKLNRSDEDIYIELIHDIGGCHHIVPVRDDALESWIHLWEKVPKTKIGWKVKVLGSCKNAKGYTNTINYFGSSAFDTAQMSRLIELIVQECKEQGIETMTPAEIERLEKAWSER